MKLLCIVSLLFISAQKAFFKNHFSYISDEAYVICKHGKSKHSGVWNLKRLIESNRQLKQIDELKCNEDDFVRPRDGNIGATLSSKVLIFN